MLPLAASQRSTLRVLDNASYHVPLASYGADNSSLARTDCTTASFLSTALVLVAIAHLPANESFIHLDNAAKLFDILDQCGSNLVAHEPSGFVGTETHVAHDLQRAHSFFADQHKVGDLEPIAEGLVRVLEYGPGDMGEPIAVWGALLALPMPLAGWQVVDPRIATARAANAFRPSAGNQISLTGFLIWEHGVELGAGELVDGLGLFAGHSGFPLSVGEYCHG